MDELFDVLEARHQKRVGMAAAADAKPDLLEIARQAAEFCAKTHWIVCSDDVARRMADLGFSYDDLGNARGSIFRSKKWIFTGEYVQSKRPASHAREIKVWRLDNGTH